MDDEAANLEMTVASSGDVATITLVGELDPHTASRAGEAIDAALADPASTTVVMDLSGIDFIDSSGLRLLIRAQNELEESDRQLVVRHPSAAVKRLFDITGLVGRVKVEDLP